MKNYLFDLKIKELEALNVDFKLHNDVLILIESKNILGCRFCYMVKPEPDLDGYKIPKGKLINYYNAYPEHQGPVQMRINCWLCPHCGRLFEELFPDYEYIGVKSVSL